MRNRQAFSFTLLIALTVSCSTNPANSPQGYPTYDPFVQFQGSAAPEAGNLTTAPVPTRTPGPTPTRARLSITIPTRDPQSPLETPTPDRIRVLPTVRAEGKEYMVQAGDSLGSIAQAYGISVNALARANGLTDENLLSIGQILEVPAPHPGSPGSALKVIPDSELVFGPAAAQFDVSAFTESQGGYLSGYTQDANGETLSGSGVVTRIAEDYSVNPRLLLALLEYRSRWVTSADPPASTLDYPLGFVEPNHVGLYHQLAWAANELNRGFYLWRAGAVGHWVLNDGSIVPINPTINAGTAGVQNFFSILDDRPTWDTDVNTFGLFQSYFFLFGNPFDLALEPLTPPSLKQPRMALPFEHGVTWAFTGGPHAAWDSGSAWGALDFAPSDVSACAISEDWITAVADGFIVRAANGAVLEDLDGDGYEQTGWDVLYMHVASQDRIETGRYAYAGDRIGHASCEGGIANAAHLHLARKYNGEWIPADGVLPFVLGGWTSGGTGIEYDGSLRRGSSRLEAFEGVSDVNQITP